MIQFWEVKLYSKKSLFKSAICRIEYGTLEKRLEELLQDWDLSSEGIILRTIN